jgi:3-hydroxyacyl-[acyl-carrier-protein] dehydratase
LHLHVEFAQKRARVCKFVGRAMVGDQIAAEAEFMAMIAEPPA